jgi:hypothetical protein
MKLLFLSFITLLLSIAPLSAISSNSVEYQVICDSVTSKYSRMVIIPSNIGILGDKNHDFTLSPYADSIRFFADDANLYFVYIAEIDSTFEKGHTAKRDGSTRSDYIGIKVITQPDQFYAYCFEVSPLEVINDYTQDKDFNTDYTWNSNVVAKCTFSKHFWIVEMKIPWNDLRIWGSPPHHFQSFVTRSCYQGKASYIFPHVLKSAGPAYYQSGAPLDVNIGIKKDLNFKTSIYYTALSDLQSRIGNTWYKNVGGDMSISPSPSAIAKISIKPDFSNVPLDSAEDTYNSKYPPTITENRPFFLEDYDLFAINSDFWYTRNIVSPLYALKYTDVIQDRAFAILFLKDDAGYSPNEDYFDALAYCNTFGTSKFNLNLYGRQNPNAHYHNELGYTELSYRPLPKLEIKPSIAFSYKSDNVTFLKGYQGGLNLSLNEKDYSFNLFNNFTTTDFNADMGSVYTQGQQESLLLTFYSKQYKSFLSGLIFGSTLYNIQVLSNGEPIERGVMMTPSFLLEHNNIYITPSWSYTDEHFNGKTFYRNRSSLTLTYRKYSKFTPQIGGSTGRTLIYPLTEASDIRTLSMNFSIDPNDKVSLSCNVSYTKYDHPRTATWDNEYVLSNWEIKTVLGENVFINQGVSLIDRQMDLDTNFQYNGNMGYYANCDWKINKFAHVYFGFKTQATHFNIEGYQTFQTDNAIAYLKTQINF